MERNYECLLLLDQALSEEAVDGEITGLKSLLPESASPSFRKIGLRDLSYPVAKRTKGYYLLCHFALTGEQKKEIEGKLKLNRSVLRYLMLRVDSLPEAEPEAGAEVPPQVAENVPGE